MPNSTGNSFNFNKLIKIFLSAFFITGCSSYIPPPSARINNIKKTAAHRHLKQKTFTTAYFKIFSLYKNIKNCKTLHVYIEGDGLSWITPYEISSNPSPLTPTALIIALKTKTRCFIYLARPCQYVKDPSCSEKYWTNLRYSKKVINTYQEILNSIKNDFHIKNFNLYGYSGGGTVAALVSAFRNDVKLLTTYAGNLDTEYWCNIHNITPLQSSLNPADFTNRLQQQKQIHYIGKKDKIVPKEVFFSYYKKFKDKKNIKYKIIKNYTHSSWGK
ncbi:alpha/beta hydrolase [Nautilia sp.]